MPWIAALVFVLGVVAVFWTTREAPGRGRRWALRLAGIAACWVVTGLLSGDAGTAAKSGEYAVYLGLPAAVLYMIASRRANERPRRPAPRGRR